MKRRRPPLEVVDEDRAPRRRRPRRFWWAVTVLVVVSVVVAGGQWVLHQSFLRVQHVTFVGLRHERSAAVLAASGLESHPSMFSVSAASIERHLSRFAWISSVRVTKRWPDTLVVSVSENVAVAVAYDDHHHLRYVDVNGRDLGSAPASANLPTLEYRGTNSRRWPYASSARAAAYVAAKLPRAFDTQVSVVSEDSSGDVSLKLTTPVTFLLGPARNLTAKFVAIASVIAHSTLTPGDVVDVTVPDELAVTPPSG